jgi:hypothetical protein
MMDGNTGPSKMEDAAKMQMSQSSLANQVEMTGEIKKPIKKHFNVLHEDGSFADLIARDIEGCGALDGTVGLGT